MRRCRPSPWFVLACSGGLLTALVTFPRRSDDLVLALLFSGFVGGSVTLSYWLAGNREIRSSAAWCALLGAAWAYSVGTAQYWSSCEWFVWVDWLVIWLVCSIAQARICRLNVGPRLAAHSLLLLITIWACHVAGAVVRGFSEDPRM